MPSSGDHYQVLLTGESTVGLPVQFEHVVLAAADEQRTGLDVAQHLVGHVDAAASRDDSVGDVRAR